MPVKTTPDGYHAVTPYLTVSDAAAAIAFYVKAFGATEVLRLDLPGGKVAHAEIEIGGSRIMLGEHCPVCTQAIDRQHVAQHLEAVIEQAAAGQARHGRGRERAVAPAHHLHLYRGAEPGQPRGRPPSAQPGRCRAASCRR